MAGNCPEVSLRKIQWWHTYKSWNTISTTCLAAFNCANVNASVVWRTINCQLLILASGLDKCGITLTTSQWLGILSTAGLGPCRAPWYNRPTTASISQHFPGQMEKVIPPSCSESAGGLPLVLCLKVEVPRKHPYQMPELLWLSPRGGFIKRGRF